MLTMKGEKIIVGEYMKGFRTKSKMSTDSLTKTF